MLPDQCGVVLRKGSNYQQKFLRPLYVRPWTCKPPYPFAQWLGGQEAAQFAERACLIPAHLFSIRGSYAGLEVLTEDVEVIVILHHLFAVEEMLLKSPRLLSQDWPGNS